MRRTILIVEDEGLIALDLKRRLERAGYHVPTIADNAADALLSVERCAPAVVLMDIHLSGSQDGIEAAVQMRRRFRVPVVFVTAHSDPKTLARIPEPFGYIAKPFQNVDLRGVIETAIWKDETFEKLRVTEAWLAAALRHTADALIGADTEENIVFMNGPAEDLTGWDAAEARAKPLWEVFRILSEDSGVPILARQDAVGLYELRERRSGDLMAVQVEFFALRRQESPLGTLVVFRARGGAGEQTLRPRTAMGLGKELAAP